MGPAARRAASFWSAGTARRGAACAVARGRAAGRCAATANRSI